MASIQGIYVALLGRPADPAGLGYYNDVTQNGQNLYAIGDLATQVEYLARFQGQSTSQIITGIYQGLFNRDPEPAGLSFYANQLNSGAQIINTIAINILDGARGEDLVTVGNKLTAADAFTAAIDTAGEIRDYFGPEAVAIGRDYLDDVGAEASSIPTASELSRFVESLGTRQPVAEYSYDQLYATDPDNIGNFYLSGETADNMLRAVSFLEEVNIELALDVRTSSGGDPDPVRYEDGQKVTLFEVTAGENVEIAYAVGMDDLISNRAPDLTRGYVFKLLVDQDNTANVEWVEYTLTTPGGAAPIGDGDKNSPYVWQGEDGSVLNGDGGELGVTQSIRDFFAGTIDAGDLLDVRLEMYEREPGNVPGNMISEVHIQIVGVADL